MIFPQILIAYWELKTIRFFRSCVASEVLIENS